MFGICFSFAILTNSWVSPCSRLFFVYFLIFYGLPAFLLQPFLVPIFFLLSFPLVRVYKNLVQNVWDKTKSGFRNVFGIRNCTTFCNLIHSQVSSSSLCLVGLFFYTIFFLTYELYKVLQFCLFYRHLQYRRELLSSNISIVLR